MQRYRAGALSRASVFSSGHHAHPMHLRLFQINAFAERLFEGNPAAVCPLEHWLDNTVLQAIAAENNLSETAFFVPTARGFHLRWFTPRREIALCGHATLASAHVLFNDLGFLGREIVFATMSGELRVTREEDLLMVDLPRRPPAPCAAVDALAEGLGLAPQFVLHAEDYVAVYRSESELHQLKPDLRRLGALPLRGVIATAPAQEFDFVCRFFAPKYGIDEDPVTGSAFTQLAPYWSERLRRSQLRARQVSARGGNVHCTVNGDRVRVGGRAVKFFEGTIRLPNPL
jgi:PhzF family phenazine biosynthesis protein